MKLFQLFLIFTSTFCLNYGEAPGFDDLEFFEAKEELAVSPTLTDILKRIKNEAQRSVKEREAKTSHQAACFKNQKDILKALEQWPQDDRLTIRDRGDLGNLYLSGYLHHIPRDPKCRHSFTYRSDHVGNVWCTFHGTWRESPIMDGELDDATANLTGEGPCPKVAEREPESPHQAACFRNQKVIIESLEQFNSAKGKALTISGTQELVALRDENFLQKIPEDPKCPNSDTYRSDVSGNIWCRFHGTWREKKILYGDLDDATAYLTGKGPCPSDNDFKDY